LGYRINSTTEIKLFKQQKGLSSHLLTILTSR